MGYRERFKRTPGSRRYKKLFIISTEGTKTEPQYFQFFNSQDLVVHVKCLKGNDKTSPEAILKRMKRHLKDEGLKKSDEAWLVMDKDQWSQKQLTSLHEWSNEKENYGLAVSNPKFEYWLLLHYEDGAKIKSAADCSGRLKRHLSGYDKDIDISKITLKMVSDAVGRAKILDTPQCEKWPDSFGSTVYRLIENILQKKI
jgi:hypothetical protein